MPGRVVVEVDRIDVLVLLRWVLRVGDRAVGQHGEPLGVILRPRVVRRALQREIEGDLETLVAGCGDEFVEVVEAAELRVDRVVAALVAADGPRRSDVLRHRRHAVVAALAVHLADRVDGRQVDDVEAHLRDARQGLRRGGERAMHGVALAVGASGRSREHLVPGAESGQATVHPDAELLTASEQFAQRILRQKFGDVGYRAPRPRDRVDRRAHEVRPPHRAAACEVGAGRRSPPARAASRR